MATAKRRQPAHRRGAETGARGVCFLSVTLSARRSAMPRPAKSKNAAAATTRSRKLPASSCHRAPGGAAGRRKSAASAEALNIGPGACRSSSGNRRPNCFPVGSVHLGKSLPPGAPASRLLATMGTSGRATDSGYFPGVRPGPVHFLPGAAHPLPPAIVTGLSADIVVIPAPRVPSGEPAPNHPMNNHPVSVLARSRRERRGPGDVRPPRARFACPAA